METSFANLMNLFAKRCLGTTFASFFLGTNLYDTQLDLLFLPRLLLWQFNLWSFKTSIIIILGSMSGFDWSSILLSIQVHNIYHSSLNFEEYEGIAIRIWARAWDITQLFAFPWKNFHSGCMQLAHVSGFVHIIGQSNLTINFRKRNYFTVLIVQKFNNSFHSLEIKVHLHHHFRATYSTTLRDSRSILTWSTSIRKYTRYATLTNNPCMNRLHPWNDGNNANLVQLFPDPGFSTYS